MTTLGIMRHSVLWTRSKRCFYVLLGNIPCRLGCRTKIGRRLYPSHLERVWYYQLGAFSVHFWQDVCKVPLFTVCTVHSPESILYVPFSHKYLGVVISISHSMDEAGQGMTDWVNGSLPSTFLGGLIDRWYEATILQLKGEQQIKDGSVFPRLMRDHGNR